MSEVAVSDIFGSSAPPMSPEAAAARRAALVADPEYVKSALGGDELKQRTLADLFMLSRGQKPGSSAPAPQDVAGVQAQMSEREIADQRKVLDVWQSHMRLDDAQRFQLERGEAKESEIAEARREIARLKKDTEFTRKLTAGDVAAMDKWSKMHKVAYGMRAIAG